MFDYLADFGEEFDCHEAFSIDFMYGVLRYKPRQSG